MCNYTAAMVVASLLSIGCGPASKDRARVADGSDTLQTAKTALPARPDSGAAATSVPRVLFIGTSLTAGLGLDAEQAYPALIQDKADSAGTPIVAINAGVSGETSAGALNRIGWVLRAPADIVVLETGANDALRALPASEARANISAILDSIRIKKPKARIFLVQMEAPPNLGPQYTAAFHSMYGDLAREKGATLVPFLLNGVAGIAALNQADGLHPNVRGERIVAANVWKSLKPALSSP